MGMKLWVAAGVCLLAAGCTGTAEPPAPTATVTSTVTPPSSATTPSIDQAVSWLDGLCGAVHGYRIANNQRAGGAGGSTEVTKSSLSKMLGEMADLAGKTVTELTALPASPLEGGDAAKQYFVEKYTASRDLAAQGKQKLDAAKGSAGLDAGIKAMNDAQAALNEAYDPLSQLKLAKDSDKSAAATAEKCKPAA